MSRRKKQKNLLESGFQITPVNKSKSDKVHHNEYDSWRDLKKSYQVRIEQQNNVNFLILETCANQYIKYMELWTLLSNRYFTKFLHAKSIGGLSLLFHRQTDNVSDLEWSVFQRLLPELKYLYYTPKTKLSRLFYSTGWPEGYGNGLVYIFGSHANVCNTREYFCKCQGKSMSIDWIPPEVNTSSEKGKPNIYQLHYSQSENERPWLTLPFDLTRGVRVYQFCSNIDQNVFSGLFSIKIFHDRFRKLQVLLVNCCVDKNIEDLIEYIRLLHSLHKKHCFISFPINPKNYLLSERFLSLLGYICFVPNNKNFYESEFAVKLDQINEARFLLHLEDNNIIKLFRTKFTILMNCLGRKKIFQIPYLCLGLIYKYAYHHMILETCDYNYDQLFEKHFSINI